MAKFIGTPSCYPQLVELRKSKTASFKPNKYIKPSTIPRYYQVVGSLHMMMLERMVLGDATGTGKCVSGDTYIPTSKGLVKISSLCQDSSKEDVLFPAPENLSILSHEGERPSSMIYYSGFKKGLKIKTSQGFELLGLPHHPVLVSKNEGPDYGRLDSLKTEDFICINRKGLFAEDLYRIPPIKAMKGWANIYRVPEFVDESLSELLGFFISEGHSSRCHSFNITQFYSESHGRIRDLLLECFGYAQKKGSLNYNEEIVVSSTHIYEILESLGVKVQDKSGDRIIPSSILSSPKRIIRSFLRGYFEGDGGVEKRCGGVSCSSKSEELIKQVQIVLLLFGIVSKRRMKMVKVKNERWPYWALNFFGKHVDIFREEIGFISKRKNGELDAVCTVSRNTNLDIIPFGGALLKKSMKDIIYFLRGQPNQKGFSVKGSGWKGLVGYSYKRVIESYISKSRALTYEGLKKFIDTVDRLNLSNVVSNMALLRDTYEKNIFYDRIVDITEKEAKFFDFHVPETHNFTGNGFINHNTIQAIIAYSFLLDKDPSLKFLLITIKSSIYQWEEEFEKFTTGITTRVISNEVGKLSGYEARKLQYADFKENVMIMNYSLVLEEYDQIVQTMGKNFMVIFDECFEYHTPVILEDGSTELIGKIVTQKKEVKVLSYNEKTGKIEPKRVANFFRTPATEWWLIEGRKKPSVNCSPNHTFPTPEGKKQASDLRVGDKIYGVDRGLNDVQKQVLLGTFMGDGGLQNYKKSNEGDPSGVVLMQSFKRSRYFFLKTFVLSEHIERIAKQRAGWNKAPVWYGYTYSNPIISSFLDGLGLVSDGRRTVSPKLFDTLDPLGLAIWFCDGDSTNTKTGIVNQESFCGHITFSTHRLNKEENQILVEGFLKKWGLKFIIKEDSRGKGFYLYASGNTLEIFFDLIRPYIPSCMAYKLPELLRDGCGSFWNSGYSNSPFWGLYEDTITVSQPREFSESTEVNFKYNIEVEDNHNYFANGILVNNCTAFKGRKTKTFFACKYIAEAASRAYGLSATIIKNGLEEVFAIYDVIVPGMFGNITKFRDTYCVQELMKIIVRGKICRFPKTIGYKNIPQFKQTLDPYFLLRKKEDVAKELPKLISKKVVLEMYPEQKDLYRQALSGILYEEKVKQEFFEISDKIRQGIKDEESLKRFAELKEKYDKFMTTEGRKRGKLAALTYCQMISNGPSLVKQNGGSSKADEFVRLMKEEISTEKVILYTRFSSGIPALEILCERNGIKYVKITGAENDKERQQNRLSFQSDPNCKLIFITSAGSAAINLQAAGVIIFYDTPWSYGDLVQVLGRAQRIGSIQESILVLHLVNKGTIDVRVMNKVTDKKDLSDQVLGDTAQGALDFASNESSIVEELYEDLLKDAEEI